jgi:uncharacterized protein YndB with AHSA1/START domain
MSPRCHDRGMDSAEPEPGSRLRLEKVLSIPPQRLFGAFVDAEQLPRWFGPVGYTARTLRLDAIEGGSYRLAMQPPEGDAFHIRGTFRTVEAPHHLAFTFVYEEPDPDDQETLVTVTFEPAEQGTRVVVEQGPFKTAARCALHRDGWTDSLERLEQALA